MVAAMKGLLLLIALLSQACSSPLPSPPAGKMPIDVNAVLAPVLADLTSQNVQLPSLCIEPQTFGAPFSRSPVPSQFGPAGSWVEIDSGKFAELPAPLKAELNDAATALLRQRKHFVPPAAIKPEAVRSPWRLRQGAEKCSDTIAISSPVESNGWVFVEKASYCGGHCGSGELYALRREGAVWRVVARTGLWIS
jgi:hypothetical protein